MGVDYVWSRLIANKAGDCEITPDDECALREDIDRKLTDGWTESEVVSYLRWLEYFNNVTPEDYCLERMRVLRERVAERLRNEA